MLPSSWRGRGRGRRRGRRQRPGLKRWRRPRWARGGVRVATPSKTRWENAWRSSWSGCGVSPLVRLRGVQGTWVQGTWVQGTASPLVRLPRGASPRPHHRREMRREMRREREREMRRERGRGRGGEARLLPALLPASLLPASLLPGAPRSHPAASRSPLAAPPSPSSDLRARMLSESGGRPRITHGVGRRPPTT